MKQNIKNKILRTIKISFLLSFLLVELFGFGLFGAHQTQASNSCNYGVSFGTNGQTTAQLGQAIPFTLNITQAGGILCSNNGGTVVVGDALSTYIFFQCSVPSNTANYSINSKSICSPSNPQILIPSQFFSGGAVLHLKAGVLDGQTSSSNWSNISFDTVSGEVDVTIASTGNNTCTNDSNCSNAGSSSNGYICSANKCVEDAELPLGSHCVINPTLEDCDTSKGLACNSTTNTCTQGGVAPVSGGTQPVAPAITLATTPTVDCTKTPNSCLYNPLPENDLTHVFLLITKSFLDIMGIWAVMFIIFGGFQMVLSSGNEEAYLKAKKTITWAVLGLAVAILSFSIVAIVEDLLQANIQAPTTSSSSSTTSNTATNNNTTGNPPSNTTGNPPSNTTGNPPN